MGGTCEDCVECATQGCTATAYCLSEPTPPPCDHGFCGECVLVDCLPCAERWAS